MRLIRFIRFMRQILRDKPADLEWIEKQGLLAVKLAQIFALRPDILGSEKCLQLQKLYQHAVTIPSEDVQLIIDEKSPKGFKKRVIEMGMEPFAAASVGQVHIGKLDTGEKVAIKVIKSDFEQAFKRDIKRMRKWLRFGLGFSPRLRKVGNPIALLKHVEDYTLRELDLRNEIKGQLELNEIKKSLNDKFPMPMLTFPNYWEEISNQHILVSEFIEGNTIRELMDKKEVSWDQLLQLFRIHGAYMFGVGTFHGDLHPGNCIINQEGKFVFIDNGAICHSPKNISKSLFNFFYNLSNGNKKQSFESLLSISEQGKNPNYDKYFSEMDNIYLDFENRKAGEESLTKIMMKTVRTAVVHAKADFGEEAFPIIRSLMYLDGIVITSYPNIQLISEMRPYLEEFRVLHSSSEEINNNQL